MQVCNKYGTFVFESAFHTLANYGSRYDRDMKGVKDFLNASKFMLEQPDFTGKITLPTLIDTMKLFARYEAIDVLDQRHF